MINELLTTRQVAERLGLSVWTVTRLIRDGKLPATRTSPGAYLVHPDVVAAYEDYTHRVAAAEKMLAESLAAVPT